MRTRNIVPEYKRWRESRAKHFNARNRDSSDGAGSQRGSCELFVNAIRCECGLGAGGLPALLDAGATLEGGAVTGGTDELVGEGGDDVGTGAG